MSEKLLESCMEGDLNQVKALLTDKNNPIDIHHKDSDGWNALMKACYYGNLEIVQYLLTSNELKKHANIHDENSHAENALMMACSNGGLEIVKYLLTSKELKEHANIHDKDEDGWNILMYACDCKHYEVAHYLIIDQNMKIDQETIDLLTQNNNEDILEVIKTHDLYQKMNNSLPESNTMTKKRKI